MAQVLLTLEDSERRRRYLNARATLESLLALGALPVINENDTVATAEIRYGDNDRLAARVAQMAGADCLVLLSDVEGLLQRGSEPGPQRALHRRGAADHPRDRGDGRPFRFRRRLRRHGDQDPGRENRRVCGLLTCASPPAHQPHPLRRIEAGARCTWFVPTAIPGGGPQAVDRRHVATRRPDIDAGALRALLEGKSLLPAGVIAARGRFDRGDTVSVFDADGTEIARGISRLLRRDAARIMGRSPRRSTSMLGFRGRDEMIHRDDLRAAAHGCEAGGRGTGIAAHVAIMETAELKRLMDGLGRAAVGGSGSTCAGYYGPEEPRPRRCGRRRARQRQRILAPTIRDMSAARAREQSAALPGSPAAQ